MVLPSTGRYVLVFYGENTTAAFDYSFRVVTPTTSSTAMTLGSVVDGTIEEPGEVDEYTFTGTAGQRIAIDLLNNLGYNIRMFLYDALGNQLYDSYYSNDLHSLTLVRSGQYRLVVDGSGSSTGVYSFRVVDLATAETPTIGTDKAVVTVLLSAPTTDRPYVYYNTADGTATVGSDYVGRSGYVQFAPGVTSRVIVVPIVGDKTVEPDETVRVVLSSPSSGQTITDGESIVTILNDDTVVTLAIDDVIQAEGSDGGTTDFVFTVTLSSATTAPVTVAYKTTAGTAAEGADYTATTGTLTFAPGETSKTITVRVAADTDGEANETFFVDLSSPTNAEIADARGQGTILNDDARVSIDDVAVTEGDSGTTSAVFTVTLSSASSLPISVNWATANGSAVAPSDYATASGTITFAPGETSKTITVPVQGDANVEGDETFFVNLSNAINAAFTKSQGQATIRNDDAAFYVNDPWIVEGDSGTKNLQFTVYIPYATTKTVTVKYATADGSATAGSDYTAATGTLTFAPGETSKVVDVTIQGDATPEPSETVLLNLSDPTNAVIADAHGVGTIYNDDTTVSVADATIVEGDSGTSTVLVTVQLSVASSSTVTVNYATQNNSATAGSDYVAASGTLTFGPGETSKTIAIVVNGDTTAEANETFFVNLSSPTSALIADPQAVVTIFNDDGSLSVAGVSAPEGNSGPRAFNFVVSLAYPSTKTVTVAYETVDGTATAGSDYTAVSGVLTFAPGEVTKVVQVQVQGDVLVEDDETFQLVLSDPTNAALAAGSATGTIQNDEATPSLSIGSVSVGEGNSGSTPATFTVVLSTASAHAVTVKYATSGATATSGVDFTAASGTLTFAPGQTSKTITIDVLGDLLDEDDETFKVTLSDPTNATIADAEATGTILDDDATPTISIADRTVSEGDSGTTPAVFTVTLSAASGKAITVAYATSGVTATSGVDFTATSGTLTFAPGELTKTITVGVLGDTLVEPDETFKVTLSAPTDATIADGEATGTILDDESLPGLSIDDVSTTEGSSGTAAATFTVTLSAASASTVTVAYATSGVTATSGADFTAASGTLTFAPGETSKTITIDVLGDALDEDDETFKVTLSAPTNAVISDGEASGTILDDDAAPTISIGDATATEGDAGTVDAVFTVTLSAASGKAVTVAYATSGATATSGVDFDAASGVLTFAPGETSKTITVKVKGDALPEGPESFLVALSNPVNATISDGQGTGLIVDDDGAPSLLIEDVAVIEGNSGATQAEFRVTLSAASGQTVTVQFATSGVSASSGIDFTEASGTLTFAPGETVKIITVDVLGDTTVEADETFKVTLSTPNNAVIADGEALGTIRNDDARLSISDATVDEGDSGTRNATFTVSIEQPSALPVSVDYSTAGITATSGVDFTAASGTLTFAPGETTKTITVAVLGDALDEDDETFKVTLSNPNNATVADGEGAGTILDDDTAPTISIGDATAAEGGGSLVFTVTLSAASGKAITVAYGTSGATATSGVDFTATSGTITFAPGETSKTISVPIAADSLDEDDETFKVTLSSPTNATIADEEGLGTILDDDAAPTISIGDATATEGDSGTVDAVFTVTLSAASGKTVAVAYATASGSATSGVDFDAASGTLTFAPGETSKTITVKVKGDTTVEADETFAVNLASPSNATIADGTALGTILNDDHEADPAPTVASIVVDDGTAQRSMVRSLTVTFSEEVSLLPGAFDLRLNGGSAVAVSVATHVEAGRTVAVLTFSGPGVVAGSLADGNYTLTILADKVADAAGQHLDGNGDGAANDAAIFELYRFFGDLDGDRDVDAADYAKLYSLRGVAGYLSALDVDGDGDVDADDTRAFQVNYRKTLKKS